MSSVVRISQRSAVYCLPKKQETLTIVRAPVPEPASTFFSPLILFHQSCNNRNCFPHLLSPAVSARRHRGRKGLRASRPGGASRRGSASPRSARRTTVDRAAIAVVAALYAFYCPMGADRRAGQSRPILVIYLNARHKTLALITQCGASRRGPSRRRPKRVAPMLILSEPLNGLSPLFADSCNCLSISIERNCNWK